MKTEELVRRWRSFGAAFEAAEYEAEESHIRSRFLANAKTFRQCADELEAALKEEQT